LDELAGQFDQLKLNEAECVEGFDPNDLFTTNIPLMGYSSYFTNIENFKGGGDNLNHPKTLVNESMNDVEYLASTNECYRKQGREVTNENPNSHTMSQRSTSTKTETNE